MHRIEAGRFDEAIADARSLAEVAPKKAAEPGFKRGFALSALEIEGHALARQGKHAEAADVGVRMYEASPFDWINVLRSARLVALAPKPTPAHQAFWMAASRLRPELAFSRASADEWAGDFAGAADDLQAYYDTHFSFRKDTSELHVPEVLARAALNRMLAGDQAGSDAVAEAARKSIEGAVRSNVRLEAATQAQELLDLQAIAKLAAQGKMAEARRGFASRGRWLAPSGPVAAELTRRLREQALPAELTGALALDPATIRADAHAALVRSTVEQKNVSRLLLDGRRMAANEESPGGSVAKKVWNVTKSPYRQKPVAKDPTTGTVLFAGYGSGGADVQMIARSLALHAALLAKAEGKTRVAFMPSLRKTDYVIVRFGTLGEFGFAERTSYDVEALIRELSPLIPQPPPKA